MESAGHKDRRRSVACRRGMSLHGGVRPGSLSAGTGVAPRLVAAGPAAVASRSRRETKRTRYCGGVGRGGGDRGGRGGDGFVAASDATLPNGAQGNLLKTGVCTDPSSRYNGGLPARFPRRPHMNSGSPGTDCRNGSGLDARTPRILIVRLSAIGDVIHGVPVLVRTARRRCRRRFWAGSSKGGPGDLLEGHPALDELVRVPRGWLKSPREVWRLRRRLHELRFDTTIDLQCLTKSAIAAWLSGAPRRIGKGGSDGRELSRWFHNELVAVRRHACDRTLSRPAQAAGDHFAGGAIRFAGARRGRAKWRTSSCASSGLTAGGSR